MSNLKCGLYIKKKKTLNNECLWNFHFTFYQLKDDFSSHKRFNSLTYRMHFLPVFTHPNTSSHMSAAQVQVSLHCSP